MHFDADNFLHSENTCSIHMLGMKRLSPQPTTGLRNSHIGLLSNASIAVHQCLRGSSLVQQVQAEIVLLASQNSQVAILSLEKIFFDTRNFFPGISSRLSSAV